MILYKTENLNSLKINRYLAVIFLPLKKCFAIAQLSFTLFKEQKIIKSSQYFKHTMCINKSKSTKINLDQVWKKNHDLTKKKKIHNYD